ncbi:MAG: alpha/beta fold hydrolase [Acidimicrobiales bacterium]
MIDEDETFDGTWPFQPFFYGGCGFKQHYVVEPGPSDPILLLHGEPTWGYLYRRFITPLSRFGTVVVPDHMGFGKSETPQDRRYDIRDHVDNLEGLIDHLAMERITIVGQDWGGPIGVGYALRHPERVKRLVLMNTGVPGQAPEGVKTIAEHEWYQWIHGDTGSEAVLSNLGSTILSVMKRIGFERTDHVDETWIRAYAAPFPTPADCKGAVQLPQCIGHPDTTATMLEHIANLPALASKPAMYVHGEADRAIPTEWACGVFKSVWPDAPVVTLPGVGHFLQEDAPDAVIALIQQFLQVTD